MLCSLIHRKKLALDPLVSSSNNIWDRESWKKGGENHVKDWKKLYFSPLKVMESPGIFFWTSCMNPDKITSFWIYGYFKKLLSRVMLQSLNVRENQPFKVIYVSCTIKEGNLHGFKHATAK